MSQSYSNATTRPIMCRMRQASDHFGISRTSIYRGAEAGQIKLIKMGRTTLVDVASLQAYIDNLPAWTPKSKLESN